MATAGRWSTLDFPLDKSLVECLESLGFPSMTPCQAAGITPIMRHQDVSVEAETGSGKTLSFLVPIAQLLLFSANTAARRPQPSVRALIIVPTRELAAQVAAVARALFDRLPGGVVPVPLIGGESAKHGPGPPPSHAADTRVVVATPGRLNAAMNAGCLFVRDLEMLIMDEADRLLDMGFSVALTSILTRLPKQRRTGLYSATQTEEVESLARAGLRNPVKVTVRVKTRSRVAPEASAGAAGAGELVAGGDAVAGAAAETGGASASASASGKRLRQVIPASLSCYYAVLQQDHKLHHFTRLLGAYPDQKFIVYVLTCASVDFFARLPFRKLIATTAAAAAAVDRSDDGVDGAKNAAAAAEQRPIVALHGKMSQAKRTRALDKFANSPNALLICTDVAARGLDIPDVDWIVQFDPPQDPDAYVHRVGRTARLGRDGRSLVYLAPHEDAYVDFLSVRRCPVQLFAWPDQPAVEDSDKSSGNDDDAAGDDDNSGGGGDGGSAAEGAIGSNGICATPEVCKSHAALVRQTILDDRAVLDVAEKAFLSYLRAYKEHRCSFLLQFSHLDIGSVARSFSMLRLPRFQEFKKHRASLNFEKDTSVRIRDVAYRDKVRERKRQADIKDAVENRGERRDALKEKSKKGKKRKAKKSVPEGSSGSVSAPGKGAAGGRRQGGRGKNEEEDDENDLREMDEEARMIKKVRRGKLSMQKFDEEIGYAGDAPQSSDDEN